MAFLGWLRNFQKMRTAYSLLAFAVLTLAGCPAPQTTGARMQDAASELNTNTRFGRMELAIERVAPTAREEFVQHRRMWGGAVRIADYEMVGAKLTAEEDADVTLRVAWYRADEQELKSTTVRQKWHDHKGDWLLVSESRIDGEPGLLGEQTVTDVPREPRGHAQFPTVRIGGSP